MVLRCITVYKFNLPISSALTIKNFSQKNLPFYGKISDNIINHNYFSHYPRKERRFL